MNVLKGVHFVLNRMMKKNIKLHPDEITRVSSKTQVKNILGKANFGLTQYYFGARDFFTHAIVVAEKECFL